VYDGTVKPVRIVIMEEMMLVVNGFIENGVFIPEQPLVGIEGRQRAVLRIEHEEEKLERVIAWKEFSQAIRASDEILVGEPQRLCLFT